MMNIVRCP